jgi:hypothetical protein
MIIPAGMLGPEGLDLLEYADKIANHFETLDITLVDVLDALAAHSLTIKPSKENIASDTYLTFVSAQIDPFNE